MVRDEQTSLYHLLGSGRIYSSILCERSQDILFYALAWIATGRPNNAGEFLYRQQIFSPVPQPPKACWQFWGHQASCPLETLLPTLRVKVIDARGCLITAVRFSPTCYIILQFLPLTKHRTSLCSSDRASLISK